MSNIWYERKKRIFQIIEVGNDLDEISRGYDFLNAFAIILNLTASILYTFSGIREQYGNIILLIEYITVAFFAADYALRVWTAQFLDTDIFSTGCSGIPNASSNTNFSTISNQCLL